MTLEENRKWKRDYMRGYYHRNKDKMRERGRRYARSHAKEAVERVRKWRIKNRQRWLKQLRERYAKNPEAKLSKNRQYFDRAKQRLKNYRRRARLKKAIIEDCSKKIALLQLERFCRWCCANLSNVTRTIDHVIPLARGGHHIPVNLVSACSKCNFSRRDKLIEEWLPYQTF